MRKARQIWSGLSKADALVLAFVGLKLSGQLDWSWWWVLSPQWISCIVAMTISIWRLFRSRNLRKKVYRPEKPKWSWAFRASDGLFLLLFVLKWTGHLSWSWFWVLSPIWLFKAIGLVELKGSKAVLSKKERRYERFISSLYSSAGALITITLVVLRLDGHISSWWWVAAASVFSLLLMVALGIRTEAALSRRLRREKAKRKACRSRDGTEERLPARSERVWFDPGPS